MSVIFVFINLLLCNLIDGLNVSAYGHEVPALVPNIFHVCKHDTECNFKHGQCNHTSSQCECKNDYVPSKDNQQCLPVGQTFGFPCTEDKQCLLANSTCLKLECSCVSGYHYKDEKCWRSAAFGTACQNNQECSHVIDAFCTEKKLCECGGKATISNSGKKCLPIVQNISDDCEEDAQCKSKYINSLCIDEKCQCNEKSHFEPDLGECIINSGLDDSCARDHDCYQGELNMSLTARVSLCVNNQCICANDYRREGDKCVANGALRLTYSLVLVLLTIVHGLHYYYHH